MKKHLVFLLTAVLLSFAATAQNGFYLAPSVGAGISSSTLYPRYDKDAENTMGRTSIFSYNANAGIGYRYKKWRFQSGLQYNTTGYQLKGLSFPSDFDPGKFIFTGTGSYKLVFHQLAIPLQVGYAIPLSKRLTLVPSVGLMAAYTLNGTSTRNENGTSQQLKWGSSEWNSCSRFSLWGQASLNLEYKVNNKITIFGGPSIQYQLYRTPNSPEKRFYNLHFNLGATIGL